MPLFSPALRIFAVALIALVGPSIAAQTTNWTGALSADWFDAGNWDSGVPDAVTSAVVPVAGNLPSIGSGEGICAGLSASAGASVTIASGAFLRIQGGSVSGTTCEVDGDGVLRLDSVTVACLTLQTVGLEVLGDVQVNAASSWTVNGSVDHSAGVLNLASLATVVVNGDYVLAGGSLAGPADGMLTVTGLLDLQSTVTMDTPGLDLGTCTMAAGTDVRCPSSVVSGDVQIGGALTLGADDAFGGVRHDFAADLRVEVGGAVVLTDDAWAVVSGDLDVFGSMSSSGASGLRLAGSGTVAGGGDLPRLEIDGVGARDVQASAVVGGDLDLIAGDLSLASAVTLSPQGFVSLSGGTIAGGVGSVLAVGGDCSLIGVARAPATDLPALRLAGDLSQVGSFDWSGSTLELIGVLPQTLDLPDGTDLATVTIGPSAIVNSNDQLDGGALQVDGSLSLSAATSTSWQSILVSGTGIALFNNATRLTVLGSLQADGILGAPSAVLNAADQGGNGVWSLTQAIGGSLSLGSGEHRVAGDMTLSGSLSVGSPSVFVLDGAGTVDCDVQLPALRIESGGYTLSAVDLAGDLDHVIGSGTGALDLGAVAVGGDASFASGLVTGVGAVLDVAGSVDFSPTVTVSSPPDSILVGGNWNAGSEFAPGSGMVRLDGTGAVALTGAGSFFDLDVASTSLVTADTGKTVAGELSVAGSLDTADSSPMDLVGGGEITGSGSFPDLRVAGASSYQVGSVQVDGDFELAAGQLVVQAAATLSVAGDTIVSGGSLSGLSGSFLDLAGAFSWTAGSPGAALPDVFCAGDVNVAVALDVSGSRLELDGVAPQALQLSADTRWDELVIAAGSQVTTPDPIGGVRLDVLGELVVLSSDPFRWVFLEVAAGGRLQAASTLFGVNQLLEVAGELDVSSATLALLNPFFGTSDPIGAFRVLPGGVVSVGSGEHVFGLSFEVEGSATFATGSTVRFQAFPLVFDFPVQTPPGLVLEQLVIGGASRYLLESLTVSGDIVYNPPVTPFGLPRIAFGQVSVGGDLLLSSGQLEGLPGGAVTVAGSVQLTDMTAVSGQVDFECSGDWTADDTFVPVDGSVRLLANGASIVSPPGESAHFSSLELPAGVAYFAERLAVGSSALISGSLTLSDSLQLGAGAVFDLDPSAALTLDGPGVVSIQGLGSTLRLDGAIAARNFTVAGLDADGVQIEPAATFAAFPFDFRGGVFDGSTSPAGAALLTLGQSGPLDLYDLEFRTVPGGATVNVRATSGQPVRVINYTGDLGGEAFEDDALDQVEWSQPGETEVEWSVEPGVNRVFVGAITAKEVDADRFRITRATSPAGPFAVLADIAPAGDENTGASYQLTDTRVLFPQRYWYRLEQDLPLNGTIVLAEASAVPWPQELGDAVFVGPGGSSDIGAALEVVPAGGRILVSGGTYPPFTVTKAVQIIAIGADPVWVQTMSGPIQIRDVAAGAVEIYGLSSVRGLEGGCGLQIIDSAATVILDRCDLRGGTALDVRGSPQVAIQDCVLRGSPALSLSVGSTAFLSNGTMGFARVDGSSRLVYGGIGSPVILAAVGATVEEVPQELPRIGFDNALRTGFDVDVTLTAAAGSIWTIYTSDSRGFSEVLGTDPTSMVLLLDPSSLILLDTGTTPGSGSLEIPVPIADDPALWGVDLALQCVAFDPGSGDLLMGNLRSAVILP